MEKQNSLRDRKKEKTRQALIDASIKLFLKNGYDNTTVDDIAEHVEVSRRTFFRYFQSKESVVFTGHEGRITLFREILEKHFNAEKPLDGVRAALTEFARDYANNAEDLRIEWEIVIASPILIAKDVELDFEFESALAETLMDKRCIQPYTELNAKILAGALFGVIRASMQAWFSGGCKQDLFEIGKNALSIFK